MTVVGGSVVFMPAVIVVFALVKLFGALKVLAKALSPLLGIEYLSGGLVLDLLAVIAILLLCFVAGLLPRGASAKRMREKLDRTLLNSFSGYAFIKGFADNVRHREELAGSFIQVVVQFDDYVQVTFETHRGTMARSLFICGLFGTRGNP